MSVACEKAAGIDLSNKDRLNAHRERSREVERGDRQTHAPTHAHTHAHAHTNLSWLVASSSFCFAAASKSRFAYKSFDPVTVPQ